MDNFSITAKENRENNHAFLITLDAKDWSRVLDLYDALLLGLGAPKEHGRSIGALLDSMVWGFMNDIEPPYTIRIVNTEGLAKDIRNEIDLLAKCIIEDRAAHREQDGTDVDVNIEVYSRNPKFFGKNT